MNKDHKKSKIVLVGAGPGDPDLITLKGIHYLQRADVVIRDYLANEKLLSYCKSDAEIIYVGKKAGSHSLNQEEINQLLNLDILWEIDFKFLLFIIIHIILFIYYFKLIKSSFVGLFS